MAHHLVTCGGHRARVTALLGVLMSFGVAGCSSNDGSATSPSAGPSTSAAPSTPADSSASDEPVASVATTSATLSSTARNPTPSSPSTATEPTAQGETVGEGEEWVVFQGADYASGLSLTRADGTGTHRILDGLESLHPDWSPDGSEILYVDATDGAGQVWITDPAGATPRPLVETYPDGLEDLSWDNPAWSRDGAEVAMIGYDGDPNAGAPNRSVLAIADVSTGTITVAGELALDDGFLHSFPRWSPDGQAFVLNVDHFDGLSHVGSTVAVVRAEGDSWSAPVDITEVGNYGRVDWHPTDDLIVFGEYDIGAFNETDEPTNLFTIRADGSQRSAVTTFGEGARAREPGNVDGRRANPVHPRRGRQRRDAVDRSDRSRRIGHGDPRRAERDR